ncbi:MAG: tautomerase family protein [Acidimicrobiia bacterium]|jgi:4-oxalocrotonate tautomerase
MPLVHVDMMGGRPPEKVAAMIRGISEAIATSLDADIQTVRVVVNEMEPHQYGVGGRPWPEVLEERRKAEEQRP